MDEAKQREIEAEIRRLCDASDHDGATTAALRSYGPEIFGFLVALHRDEEDAAEVFSQVSERIWKGLPKFQWGSSFRTWAYVVARNTSYRYRKNARRERGNVPLSVVSAADQMVARVRTETKSFLKTEQKDKFAAVRETLSPEEQTLLILRIDRGLQWDELARVMMDDEETATEEVLKKEAARLRKRFQLLKDKLLVLKGKAGFDKPKG
jgi:RNA polymerase sigma-70 factor (ECF subfamily)